MSDRDYTFFRIFCVFALPLFVWAYGCTTGLHRKTATKDIPEGESILFKLREERHKVESDSASADRIVDSLRQLHAASKVDYEQGQEQLSLWMTKCDAWNSSRIPGTVNTDADEYSPILANDSLLYFTRGNGVGALCYSDDVFSAELTSSGWKQRTLGRPVNTCHNESITSISCRDSVAYVYGQYYTRQSHNDGKIVLTANYPNDLARRSTVTYVYDPISDFQIPNYFLIILPILAEHNAATHRNYVSRSRASTIIDYSGDLYRYRFVDGRVTGSPIRMGWPVSGFDWDSDAILSPDGLHLFFVSDRPNDIFPYEEKPPYLKKSGNAWGNTNIFYMKIGDTVEKRHYLLGPKINTFYAERTPSFSEDGDTLFFSSNGLPGFGGMDVFYSVRLRAGSDPLWSVPKNLGPGVNTSSDELWFKSCGRGRYTFSRRANGNLDIYMAERKPVLSTIELESSCGDGRALVITEKFYDGHTEARRLKSANTTIRLDDRVQTFSITVEGQSYSRNFERCPVQSDTVKMTEDMLSTNFCGNVAATSQGPYHFTWQFLQNELSTSVREAVGDICVMIETSLGTQKFDYLSISLAPSHYDELFYNIIQLARKRGASISLSRSSPSSAVSEVYVRFK